MSGQIRNLTKCQEICDLADIVKMHRSHYINNKILRDNLHKCLREDAELSEELKTKANGILCASEIEDCMKLKSEKSGLRLLGLAKLYADGVELSYEDQNKLKRSVENSLVHTCNMFDEKFKLEISSAPESMGLLDLSFEDKVLVDFKSKHDEVQKIYRCNLLTYYKCLEDFLQLRMEDVKEAAALKVKECRVQIQKYRLQSEVVKETHRKSVFAGESVALDAHRDLVKDILEEQDRCREEIMELRIVKEKYQQVACKQFDEILRDYVKYKGDLDRKKLLFQQTKQK